MHTKRPIHQDFHHFLVLKDEPLINLFLDLRTFILDIYPDSNELLYHTQALTAVFSISEKLSDAFCHIPIYTNHLNLGFNKGNCLIDPNQLLQGTGKTIRHIPIHSPQDYKNIQVKALVQNAIDFTMNEMSASTNISGKTISKIKFK